MAHKWTEGDDLVALYVASHGNDRIGTLKSLGERLGMGEASLRMRVGNFKSLAGQGGLTNAARQSIDVWEQHGRLPERECPCQGGRRRARRALGRW